MQEICVEAPHDRLGIYTKIRHAVIGVAITWLSIQGLLYPHDQDTSPKVLAAPNGVVDTVLEDLPLSEPAAVQEPAVRNPDMPYQMVLAPIIENIPDEIRNELISKFVGIAGCSGSKISEDIDITAIHCIPISEGKNSVPAYLVRAYPGGKETGSIPETPDSILFFEDTDIALLLFNGINPEQAVEELAALSGSGARDLISGEPVYIAGSPKGFEQTSPPIVIETAAIEGNSYSTRITSNGSGHTQIVNNAAFTVGNLNEQNMGCSPGESGGLAVDDAGDFIGIFSAFIPISSKQIAGYKEDTTTEEAMTNVKYVAKQTKSHPIGQVVCILSTLADNASYTIIDVTG